MKTYKNLKKQKEEPMFKSKEEVIYKDGTARRVRRTKKSTPKVSDSSSDK